LSSSRTVRGSGDPRAGHGLIRFVGRGIHHQCGIHHQYFRGRPIPGGASIVYSTTSTPRAVRCAYHVLDRQLRLELQQFALDAVGKVSAFVLDRFQAAMKFARLRAQHPADRAEVEPDQRDESESKGGDCVPAHDRLRSAACGRRPPATA